MERKVKEFLQKWKTDVIRKPMIIYGSKQVGKTFTVLEFGKEEYKNIVYFNTDNNKSIIELFKKERSTEKIILNLSLEINETILKDDTLIILDNVNDIEIIKDVDTSVVNIGAKVKLYDETYDEENEYILVSYLEGDDVTENIITE